MGDLLRQYWMPALMPSELPSPGLPAGAPAPAGREPHRLPRTSGEVGIIAERLPAPRRVDVLRPQRGGRGLRCVYHGWKFDVDRRLRRHAVGAGRVELQEQGAHARAYPTRERNGIIWTYMGPRETPPPLPDLPPNLDPRVQRRWTRPCASATTCRRWRATSTRCTSASCTPALRHIPRPKLLPLNTLDPHKHPYSATTLEPTAVLPRTITPGATLKRIPGYRWVTTTPEHHGPTRSPASAARAKGGPFPRRPAGPLRACRAH